MSKLNFDNKDDGSSETTDIDKAVCEWEDKELMSRDGQAQLKAPFFFASFDQRSDKAAGASACTTLIRICIQTTKEERNDQTNAHNHPSLLVFPCLYQYIQKSSNLERETEEKKRNGETQIILHVLHRRFCVKTGPELQTEEQPVRPIRFVKKLKEYHFLDQRLEIPKEFSSATAVGSEDKIRLQDWKGKKWTISITDRNNGIRAFSAGWKRFLNANKLKVGAILLFDFDMDSRDVIKVEVLGDQEGQGMLDRATYGGVIPSV
ncbi:uncharacterized protein LOC125214722 [Salvia hispanica]|uniref:uncharacterized protein LOC125214722 n=1 Tax=Salvia hispanica TaxID=49212 RepID=UPI002009CA76|nr:uncharacterized protein LOC125214722 [Salvia hispanica]